MIINANGLQYFYGSAIQDGHHHRNKINNPIGKLL